MRFSFPHSHAFPGGRLTAEINDEKSDGCMVEFGDGTHVVGAWTQADNGFVLAVPGYQTARGTTIGAKQWLIVHVRGDVWKAEKM